MERITNENPLSKSKELVQENIEKLKELFPTIVKEGEIDFSELEVLLGKEIIKDEEYYQFTWAGKSHAKIEANKLSTGTLRPCKEESKNWDTTKNIFIEGDNLEVLKLMQKSYAGKIKMIYFDPPYNTGNDFIYKDDYADNIGNYLRLTGQSDEIGARFRANPESEGRYHSNWLNMMYPRIKLAYNLLRNNGFLFISIDDNEVCNLRKLCDEIFGEIGFIAQIMSVANPGGRDYNQVAVTHEYILCYAKTEEAELNEISKEVDFRFSDKFGGYNVRELRNRNPRFHSGNRPNLFYPFFVNPNLEDENGYCAVSLQRSKEYYVEVNPLNSTGKESVWRWGRIKSEENITHDSPHLSQVIAKQKSNGGWNIYEKNRRSTTKVKSIWDETQMRTEDGTRLIRHLFSETVFDHPKSLDLIKRIVEIGCNNGLVLDIFAGTATTAHAVMKLNAEDNEIREFIMVQLPEPTGQASEANKLGYQTIADIGKERIRRAGDKILNDIKEELATFKKSIDGKILQEDTEEKIKQLEETIQRLDIGFKVFKLDSSNILAWDGSTDNLEQNLLSAVENIKPDRKEDDVLYEILIKYGIDLAQPIEEKNIADCKVFSVGLGVLFVCLSDKIKSDVADGIGNWKNELQPEVSRVVFKDSGFAGDVEKTNAIQILKRHGITDVKSI